MPRSQQARYSFDSGVLSPRLTMRGDSERYASACQLMENFIVTPQGGAVYRQGFFDVGQPANPANPFRVFAFKDGGDRSDAIFEVGPGITRFWRDDALIPNPTLLNVSVDNPFAIEDLDFLHFTNQENLTVITSPNHPPQLLLLSAAGTITEIDIPFDDVPFMAFFDYKSPRLSSGGDVTYEVTFGSDWNDNDPFSFEYGGIKNLTFSGTRSFGGGQIPFQEEPEQFLGQFNPTEVVYRYRSNDTEMADVIERCFRESNQLRGATIVVTAQAGEVWNVVVTHAAAGRFAAFDSFTSVNKIATADIITGLANSGTEPAWSNPYVVEHNAVFYQCLLPNESIADTEPGVGVDWEDFWIALPGEPFWWEYQHGSDNDWELDRIYAPWNRGFPRVAEFHEQRLILAGSADAPTTIWGSRLGQYVDFLIGPNDTDPIEFALDTSDTPKVQWMSSTSLGLLMGTSAGEFLISAQVSLSPSDIQSQRQNYSRASDERAIKINNVVFYAELGDTKLRASQFSRDLQGYDSIDASLMAEHLIRDPGIRRLSMMRTPESLIFILRQDGTFAFMTYNGAQGMSAWSEGATRDFIFDANSVYSASRKEDAIYVCVEREDGHHLEKMLYPRRSFSAALPTHLDSYQQGNLTTGQTVITGLERFNGNQVFLTIDNAMIGFRDVAGGSLTIDADFEDNDIYALGYQYDGRIVTFENIDGNPKGVGFGTARNWNKLFVRILDSALPKINGLLPPDRTPASPMNLPEPLRSEDARVANLGYGDGSIDILQDLPLPTYVLGVYGEFASHNI